MNGENSPLISIISGWYNREAYVNYSIQSLLDQTYDNIEIIVFDDASTDNTLSELMKFDDPRIKIIAHQKNIGFVNGLIDAINHSKGDFIAIHGSGDISYKNRIYKQVNFLLSKPSYSLVASWRKIQYSNGSIKGLKYPQIKNIPVHLLRTSNITHGCIMFSKKAYIKAGGYRKLFVYAQDRDLICRISLVGNIFILQEFLYETKFLKNGVSRNLQNKFKQRVLSNYARTLYIQRLKGSIDEYDRNKDIEFNQIRLNNFGVLETLLIFNKFGLNKNEIEFLKKSNCRFYVKILLNNYDNDIFRIKYSYVLAKYTNFKFQILKYLLPSRPDLIYKVL